MTVPAFSVCGDGHRGLPQTSKGNRNMTLTEALIKKGIVRNAEAAASEIEKAKGVFNDLLEYDEEGTSDEVFNFFQTRWGIQDNGYFADELLA